MEPARNPSTRSELARQCVKCGLCLPHCPTYALTRSEAESPRGRIALMADMAENPGDYGGSALPSLDSCLGCRRCEAACPADVRYEALLIQSRAAVAPALGWRERIALWLMAHKPLLNSGLEIYRRIYPLLPAALRPLPRPGIRQASLGSGGTTAVFTGCIADAYEARTRAALIRLLDAAGIAAAVPESQVCCGQAALHAGRSGEARRLAERNHHVLQDYERLLVLASGCFSALQGRAGISVMDAGVFLAGHAGKLRFGSAAGMRVAVHAPCSAGCNGGQAALMALLAKIPDLEVHALPDTGCCGAAGLHQVAQPVRASMLRAPLIDEVKKLRVDALLSGNIGCRLHLADGTQIPVQHPLEFMAQFLHAD
jgi:glycolate oxidase iron-sulfur subunit